jgi:hypothetical protein
MIRQHNFQLGHKRINDPINPYTTDSVTEWSDDHDGYVTTVFGKNEQGERVMKYQVRENNPDVMGPD